VIGGIELSLACLLGCFLTGYLAGKPKASRDLRAPHAPAASLSCERSAAASGAQPPAGAAVADIRVGQTRQGPQKAGTALPACFDCHAVQPCARPRATPIHQPPTCPSDTPARQPTWRGRHLHPQRMPQRHLQQAQHAACPCATATAAAAAAPAVQLCQRQRALHLVQFVVSSCNASKWVAQWLHAFVNSRQCTAGLLSVEHKPLILACSLPSSTHLPSQPHL
jgi:hypothetical protein